MQTEIATTKLSSRGQVVIPEAARKDLGLEPGTRFTVVWQGDVVMLKRIAPPAKADLEDLLERLSAKAALAGRTEADIARVLAETRRAR